MLSFIDIIIWQYLYDHDTAYLLAECYNYEMDDISRK